MAIIGKNLIADGSLSFPRGVWSGNSPNRVPSGGVSFATNARFRGERPYPRPGLTKRACVFLDADGNTDTATQNNFENGRWQGAHPYRDTYGGSYLMCSISGRFFRINIENDYKVEDLSISGDLDSSTSFQAWFVQAEEFLIRQDGIHRALIYNGSDCRRAEDDEVPVGTVMEYGMGRLWVAMPNRRSFRAGDLAYQHTFSTKDLLKFTDNDFLNEGGEFGVPVESGAIRAMKFSANTDTSLGQGPLVVFTDNATFTVQAPIDRSVWKNLSYPIQTVSIPGHGASSQNSTITVNGDIWFRSRDGIRSFHVARRDFGTWANVPMSRQVARVLDSDTQSFLRYGSGVYFDGRLMVTTTPAEDWDRGIYHQGIVALDFSPLNNLGAEQSPAWDGLWTGLKFLQIVKTETAGKERCFVFALVNDKIELWEFEPDVRFDNGDDRIVWTIESPSYLFEDLGMARKKLKTVDSWWDRIAGEVDVVAEFRSDQYPLWIAWHDWNMKAKYEDCSKDDCDTPGNYLEQFRHRVGLPEAPTTCDSLTGKPHREGFEFQIKWTVTGHARLQKMRLLAEQLSEQEYGPIVCS